MIITISRDELENLDLINETVEIKEWDHYTLLDKGFPDSVDFEGDDAIAIMRCIAKVGRKR